MKKIEKIYINLLFDTKAFLYYNFDILFNKNENLIVFREDWLWLKKL